MRIGAAHLVNSQDGKRTRTNTASTSWKFRRKLDTKKTVRPPNAANLEALTTCHSELTLARAASVSFGNSCSAPLLGSGLAVCKPFIRDLLQGLRVSGFAGDCDFAFTRHSKLGKIRSMRYESVDASQRVLVEKVFHYADDRKKAAGRALGTLVEIITYYSLKAWGFRENVAIERPLPEYGNPAITHNVEFSLHPALRHQVIPLRKFTFPLSTAKLRRSLDELAFVHRDLIPKAAHVLSNQGVMRNACTFGESATAFCIASIDEIKGDQYALTISVLAQHPFAIFECKRVGVEEGMRKGPQSIEKAKQGAYVARTVSSLQKVRYRSGEMGGVIHLPDGTLYHKPYDQLLEEVAASNEPTLLRDFILTVGVVSNHGNWFTAADHNKELRVLAQSYDWLLFLTDQGLAAFVSELLLNPTPELADARLAFLNSYGPTATGNRFTKVKIDVKADVVLRSYFASHAGAIEAWFNVITPARQPLRKLQNELKILNDKNWAKILQP